MNALDQFHRIMTTPVDQRALKTDHYTLRAGDRVDVLHEYHAGDTVWCRCAYIDCCERKVISIPKSNLREVQS